MTMSFGIVDDTAAGVPGSVAVSQHSVDALSDILTVHGARHGIEMMTFDRSDLAHLVYDFDARACLLSVSTISACFGSDPAVIALVEEAQFQNRCLRIWKLRASGTIRLDLSIHPDSRPTPEEAKLVREIETLEARMRQIERVLVRSDDYLAQIDWTAMTRDDRETATNHRNELGWTIHELDHGIEEASRELWAYCV